MCVVVIDSREVMISDLERDLPEDMTAIVSGRRRGFLREYDLAHGIKLTEYEKCGRIAPLKRNALIVENADFVPAFGDGKSARHGALHDALKARCSRASAVVLR